MVPTAEGRGDQPARVREIHREQLAKLEAGRGEWFWALEQMASEVS